MKVLGIVPHDLEKRDPATFEGTEARYALFENKRRHLIQQVTQLAVQDAEGHKPAASGAASDRNAAFMQEVLRKEKENSEMMQRMAKKEISSIIVKELETRLLQHKGNQRQEESMARVSQLLKLRDAKLKQQKKEAQKKADKSEEVRRKAKIAVQEECQALGEEIKKYGERVDAKLAQMAEDHRQEVESHKGKFVEIAKRQADFERSLIKKREQMYEDILARDQAKTKLLRSAVESRHSNVEELEERHHQCVERARSFQLQKQDEIDERFKKILARHEKAEEVRDHLAHARKKEFKVKNFKARQAFESRYERVRKEVAEEQQKLTQELEEKLLRTSRSEGAFTERKELLEVRESRYNYVELAKASRERQARAHAYHVEQELERLKAMREKVQIMVDAKAQADQRRMVMLRNTTLEKMALSDKVDRVRDCRPERMMTLLHSLEVEPDAAKRINEILGELGMKGAISAKEEDEKQEKQEK